MGTNTEHVMTIANSIIGVSVLAMPFCFKQCGIVLSILLLLISGIMSRLACHYLLKSAITARRRNFEFLAFHTFGPTGKLLAELCIIGFMLGTCIAFFVVMGDLGPAIIGPLLNIDTISTLRPSVLVGLGLLVVLPLGLLKNVDSLTTVCAASIAFYLCLVLKVMAEATTHLLSWDWVDKVNLWKPSGIPQCLPIFSMALSCQTQLFEIFDSVPNTSLDKMNSVIRSAINMCTGVYISVGLFGYIAYCTQNFSGNLLLSFSPTVVSEIMKLGFVLSVAVSFPLVIFPCRASLHSLLFRRGHTPHYELLSTGGNFIPEPRFKCLTICIVMVSLGTGLLIPSIEVVLGLVGSTIGIIICIMFPALTFICLSTKNNNERLLAQVLFTIGLVIMVFGTYTNLYATEEAMTKPQVEQKILSPALKSASNLIQLPPDTPVLIKEKPREGPDKLIGDLPDLVQELPVNTPGPGGVKKEEVVENAVINMVNDADKRKEPPVPVAPRDTIVKESVPLPSIIAELKDNKVEEQKDRPIEKSVEMVPEVKKEDSVGKDAIKREEDELKESEMRNAELQKANQEILKEMSKREEEQRKILAEQKAVLEEVKKLKMSNNKILNRNVETVDKKLEERVGGKPLLVQQQDPNIVEVKKELVEKLQVRSPNEDNLKKVENLNLSGRESNGIEKDNVVSPAMTNKMVKGVPLPLAVKVDQDNQVNQVFKTPEKSVNKDGEVLKPQVGRDILEDNRKEIVEEREKRDLGTLQEVEDEKQKIVEETGKELQKNVVQSPVVEQNAISDNLDNNPNSNDVGQSLVGIINKNSKKDPVKDEKCPKPDPKVHKIQENQNNTGQKIKEMAQHNSDSIHMPKNEHVQENPQHDDQFIKTPSVLSNPETFFDKKDIQPGVIGRGPLPDVKPLSRDLKSVQNHEDTRREERAVEVT